jgi:hypothetical protein
VIFDPLDFIVYLSALVPKPRVNLTRFHGVFAPNSQQRALVTPAKRGSGAVRIIACIDVPVVIQKILDHLLDKAGTHESHPLPESRAPPVVFE